MQSRNSRADVRRFLLKLALFLAPLLLLYSVPLLTMVASGEIYSADVIARKHLAASDAAVYGPAYTNPDKRYKLASVLLRDTPLVAVGTSRVMQFRADDFRGGEATFYNAGGIVAQLSDIRRALAHIPNSSKMKYVILGLDQWFYNDAWPGSADFPGVEAEYADASDALGNLRSGLSAWPDFLTGRLPARAVFFSPSENLGVNARARGNGFRHDGSYLYADVLRDPTSARDWQWKDTLARLHDGRDRFEAGDIPSARALRETGLLLADCRARGLVVAAFLPPFAPPVERALRTSGRHGYVDRLPPELRAVFEEQHVPLFDFTSCAALGCLDSEFIDGFHGGDVLYARLLLRMAEEVPWLAEFVEPHLRMRVENAKSKNEF